MWVNGVLPPPPNVSDQATSGQKLEETSDSETRKLRLLLEGREVVFFVRLAAVRLVSYKGLV